MIATLTAREHPIIFSAESLKSILAGRKTETRRVVKPQPPDWIDRFGFTIFTPPGHISGRGYWKGVPGDGEGPAEKKFRLRYGKPGDRLWVREAWCPHEGKQHAYYRQEHPDWRAGDVEDADISRWRSPMHMPRWASRLTLEVTALCVERLHAITMESCVAEGVRLPVYNRKDGTVGPWLNVSASPVPDDFLPERNPFKKPEDGGWTEADYWRHAFAIEWDRLNKKRAPWASNPWVWAVRFRRLVP